MENSAMNTGRFGSALSRPSSDRTFRAHEAECAHVEAAGEIALRDLGAGGELAENCRVRHHSSTAVFGQSARPREVESAGGTPSAADSDLSCTLFEVCMQI
jgi:hypothetical protein